MPKLDTVISFPYEAAQIYALIKDIESYPKFVPNCKKLSILNQNQNGAQTQMDANMLVGFKMFEEQFVSDVLTDDDAMSVDVKLKSGPLKKMQNSWQIKPSSHGCDAHFSLEVEMSGFALKIALAAAFQLGVEEVKKAFIARADQLYSN